MSYAYMHGAGGSSYNREPTLKDDFPILATLDRVRDPQLWIGLRNRALSYVYRVDGDVRRRGGYTHEAWRIAKQAINLRNGLILLWVFTLLWGERTIFRESLESCAWGGWEKWPQDATPHHVAFIADPQLVDPHTYPGRPWPLSTLTVKYTDQYLRRVYWAMQKTLLPDSVVFLGDLFDGGREWATRTSSSPDERYKGYGDKFWLKEYDRFGRIFFNHFNDGGSRTVANPWGRKLIASMPGNHDLGFGTGIQDPVRKRFQAYFGEGNRVDVIGNHSFVSVNTVSLSAMDQPDPETGSSGAGAGDGVSPNSFIWRDTQDFLDNVQEYKARREVDELRSWKNQLEDTLFTPGVHEVLEPTVHEKDPVEAPGFPTILLTHVPLYRRPATPCGPLRERYPPVSTDPLPQEDEGNSIKVAGGYQYQNVLTETISKDLISKVGPGIAHIYSGDDHDYCEIAHREFSGSPKEITVKSLSWAMGVRRPGFLMTSLWNPVDPDSGKPPGTGSSQTVQNHLCLLPDQLGIFIRYGCLLAFTLIVLIARSVIVSFYAPATSTGLEPSLPLSEPRRYEQAPSKYPYSSTSSSATSSPGYTDARLSSRGSVSLIQYAKNAHDDDISSSNERYRAWTENGDDVRWKSKASTFARQQQQPRTIIGEFIASVKYVARVVLAFYFYLIWTW
ncbi:hypothetical protein DTO164E3_8598 [Paecilomyces variotii]|nr:hypothetical protein DTO164E3_8598 [Paecilomyces variotii]KAJ9271941.1 hypothetical protein DTO212C5_2022 [Paecilomyces variotii]